jgi:dTDP-4-dehydrorhamnose 3,5-epimerase
MSPRIKGLMSWPLEMNRDSRGYLAETFRRDWELEFVPAQWHVLHSRAGTLRGMHVHIRHDDLKIVLEGRTLLALKDLRPDSSTTGAAELLELSGEELKAVLIPHGVAHGLYAVQTSVCLVGGTHLYDPGDDFEFDWADPELGIEWPETPRQLSDRDRNAPTLRALLGKLGWAGEGQTVA